MLCGPSKIIIIFGGCPWASILNALNGEQEADHCTLSNFTMVSWRRTIFSVHFEICNLEVANMSQWRSTCIINWQEKQNQNGPVIKICRISKWLLRLTTQWRFIGEAFDNQYMNVIIDVMYKSLELISSPMDSFLR